MMLGLIARPPARRIGGISADCEVVKTFDPTASNIRQVQRGCTKGTDHE
jgi:hypothetical protein